MSNPLHKKCSKCKKEYRATYEFFYRDKIAKSGLSSWCKKCKRKCTTRYGGSHREEKNKRQRLWNRQHPDQARDYNLKRYFGKNLKWYDHMVKVQDGKCAICGEPETTKRSGKIKALAVDHDHATGKVRQLLCCRCNLVVGQAGEDRELLLKVMLYLEKWAK